jgi:hypothetical protein
MGVTYNADMASKKMPADVRKFFVEMGRQGGQIGGAARAANMTAKQRSESARKAVQARWAKKKKNASVDQRAGYSPAAP